MEHLRGTGVALITPFNADGAVDVNALIDIVDYCKKGGMDYLVALGTTAETATLTTDEKQLVIDTIIHANNGTLPLVLGVGGNNTRAVVEELKTRDLSAFDAILSVTPYYNRPTQEGIYQHFKAIATASPKPVILYNVPGRTGSNMLPSTTLRLANDFGNIIAVKEACGDMVQVMDLIKHRPEGFLVLSGDDITALLTVVAGGDGVISVLGQGLPSQFSDMIRHGLEGRTKEAFELQYELQIGMKLIFKEGNPAGIKAIFEILRMARPYVRLPLVEASLDLKTKLTAFIASLSKIPA